MKTLLLTLLSVNLLLATQTNYKVLDNDGQEVKNYSLKIEKSTDKIVSVMSDTLAQVVKTDITDLNGSTQSFTWKSKNTDIKGEVKASRVYYKGVFKGKKVDLFLALDKNIPFIFNTRDSLVSFIYSNKKSMKLYVTSSAKLSAYKFKATKEKMVDLTIDDKKYKAIEVDFSMAGLAGMFVASDKLYFSAKDGRFLKRKDSRNHRVELIDDDWD